MSRYVVDASVAVKWFVPEIHHAAALRLRDQNLSLYAPELLTLELARVFVKKSRRGEFEAGEIVTSVAVAARIVELQRTDMLVAVATELSLTHGVSVYDAAYVALALRDARRLVTADRRLYNALRETHPDTMVWIEDL